MCGYMYSCCSFAIDIVPCSALFCCAVAFNFNRLHEIHPFGRRKNFDIPLQSFPCNFYRIRLADDIVLVMSILQSLVHIPQTPSHTPQKKRAQRKGKTTKENCKVKFSLFIFVWLVTMATVVVWNGIRANIRFQMVCTHNKKTTTKKLKAIASCCQRSASRFTSLWQKSAGKIENRTNLMINWNWKLLRLLLVPLPRLLFLLLMLLPLVLLLLLYSICCRVYEMRFHCYANTILHGIAVLSHFFLFFCFSRIYKRRI